MLMKRFVAVVLDDEVHSAPTVGRSQLLAGSTSISGGSMSILEAQDLANVLKAGKLTSKSTYYTSLLL